jgi:hypothetical protein
VADLRESETGAVAVYFELDRELNPGDSEPMSASFRVLINSQVRALPRLRFFADSGTERLTVAAEFPPPVNPTALWWFAAADPIDAEYRAHGREVAPVGGGRYVRTFNDLVPTWCYGLAWTW